MTSLLAAVVFALPASAQTPAMARADLVKGYTQFCMSQGVLTPGPAGESDIRNDPGLPTYCACFAGKFADRALASLGKPRTAPFDIKKATAEEYAMRNSCRARMGMPQVVPPK